MLIFLMILVTPLCFAQESDWIKTEGEITEITFHRDKRVREMATIRFTREDGENQTGSAELLRLPIIGSMKSVGDSVSIYYRLDNPALIETVFWRILSAYGMYALIFLGVILSVKPFLKSRRTSS